jgi:hypothetical protein
MVGSWMLKNCTAPSAYNAWLPIFGICNLLKPFPALCTTVDIPVDPLLLTKVGFKPPLNEFCGHYSCKHDLLVDTVWFDTRKGFWGLRCHARSIGWKVWKVWN